MSRARLIPMYFGQARTKGFDAQLPVLRPMLADVAEILEPVGLGSAFSGADAVLFPEVLGEAYRHVEDLAKLGVPILFVTSEFGTGSMWDWEIAAYLRSEGIDPIVSYRLEDTKKVCRALAARRELGESKFMVFQDNPGQGFQADIFKRFYWWEDECTERMKDKFGLNIIKKSFKELGVYARTISDDAARTVAKEWDVPAENVSERSVLSALKVYIALKEEVEKDPSIRAMGINCLNESSYSDTTPCLAWSMLYEEKGLLWGCEADTLSMLTKYIVHRSLGAVIMMTNIYPFLMGMAALKHERIPYFPEVESEPENHLLLAHCGYFGIIPKPFCSRWCLKPKVLGIVDDNANAVDAEIPKGDITLVKIHPSMERIMAVKGDLQRYVQYEDSDCLNGAVVKVADGGALANALYSHHYCIAGGEQTSGIERIAKVFGLEVEKM